MPPLSWRFQNGGFGRQPDVARTGGAPENGQKRDTTRGEDGYEGRNRRGGPPSPPLCPVRCSHCIAITVRTHPPPPSLFLSLTHYIPYAINICRSLFSLSVLSVPLTPFRSIPVSLVGVPGKHDIFSRCIILLRPPLHPCHCSRSWCMTAAVPHARMRACMHACVSACVRACVHEVLVEASVLFKVRNRQCGQSLTGSLLPFRSISGAFLI